MNEIAQQENVVALRPTRTFDLSPQTFEQALTFSQMLADSDLVPKDYKGKPGNCMVAMQWAGVGATAWGFPVYLPAHWAGLIGGLAMACFFMRRKTTPAQTTHRQ